MKALRTLVYLCLAIVCFSVFGSIARAQTEHQLLRRVVVFPIKLDQESMALGTDPRGSANASIAEDAWWQVREELTASQRFLVASKQFLVKSDVFLPRGLLEPADAVILGKLLDAHALVTMQLTGRRLAMLVYDGGNGMLLWSREFAMHPSMTVADQLPVTARKLINDFVASLPYQGYQYVDPLLGKPVYEEGDVLLAQIDVGVVSRVQTGDPVQWIRVQANNSAPLFQGGAKVTVFAEGRVVKLEQGIATVEVLRATKVDMIKEFSLVRLPREFERLQAEFLIRENKLGNLSAELAAPEISPMEQLTRERRPLVTTLSWISSVAAFLLLAF